MNNGGSHFLFATFNLGVAENVGIRLVHPDNFPQLIWLVVEPTHLRNITQIRSSPQVRFKINIYIYKCLKPLPPSHFVIWEDFVLQENVDLVQGLPGVLTRNTSSPPLKINDPFFGVYFFERGISEKTSLAVVYPFLPNPLSKKCSHVMSTSTLQDLMVCMMAGLGFSQIILMKWWKPYLFSWLVNLPPNVPPKK